MKEKILEIIDNDALAISCQSMAQYRSLLRLAILQAEKDHIEPPREEYISDDDISNLYKEGIKESNGYWTDCTDYNYSNLRKHSFRCFQDMALMLHVFSCGSYQGEDYYFIILEDVHVTQKPSGELFAMTTQEIKDKFGIDMDNYKHLWEVKK